MADRSTVADAAEMRRTTAREEPVEELTGQTCPDPDCDGTVARTSDGAVCGTCDRWLLRYF